VAAEVSADRRPPAPETLLDRDGDVTALAGCGARVEHARTLVDLGVAIARGAREELRLAGGRAPAAGLVQTGGLTPSERRVAGMAAAGQRNREIADALFITVKAVEWHLGKTYRKLGVRGRGEPTAALGPDAEE
jgi:DNA-binding CsgD family transcriptional regulator